jgi:CO/xanthine dehydrogenase FAD-binding subunit
MRPFRFVRPTPLQEVIGLLEEHGSAAALLAGGTDLVVELRDGKIEPLVIIDLKRTSELPTNIAGSDGWLTIGATTAISDVARHEVVRQVSWKCFTVQRG